MKEVTTPDDREREIYPLDNYILREHFKGFEYEWGTCRIFCAKMIDKDTKEFIYWSDDDGYNMSDVKAGDILKLQMMHPKKTRTLSKHFYKVISISSSELVIEWANETTDYTTYLKALKG